MVTQKFSVELTADFTISSYTIKMLIMDFVRRSTVVNQGGTEMNISSLDVEEK